MLLYWGQRGVSKDIAGAVKWFERSALQMKDPTAIYDYAILVLKVRRPSLDAGAWSVSLIR